MVQRHRKKSLMGNHQRSWVWGKNAVREILESGGWPLKELLLDEQMSEPEWQEWTELAEKAGVTPQQVSAARLRELCGSGEHQGWLARMRPFPYLNGTDWRKRVEAASGRKMVVILDRVQDPFNFGAILRSAECLGAAGALVGNRSQAEVTSQVVRSSAGAVIRLPLGRVENLVDFCGELKASGFCLTAATEKAAESIVGLEWPEKVALIVGNEGRGVQEELLEMCERQVAIPRRGKVESLNVAAAAAICLHEILRDQG